MHVALAAAEHDFLTHISLESPKSESGVLVYITRTYTPRTTIHYQYISNTRYFIIVLHVGVLKAILVLVREVQPTLVFDQV